jgi:hypothetical protein
MSISNLTNKRQVPAGGAVRWWLGSKIGLMMAFLLAVLGTAVGTYAGRRVAATYLP